MGLIQHTAAHITLDSFEHDAMKCTFEIHILNEDADHARAVAREAFDEVDRLEQELSRFIESSDVARINGLQPGMSLPVGPATMDCLQLAVLVHESTRGLFDITVGHLVPPRDQRQADDLVWEPNLPKSGMHLLSIRPDEMIVAVHEPGLIIDLGGIGKGYAIDQIVETLRRYQIETALIHSGQSTVYALGAGPDGSGWALDIRDPATPDVALTHLTLCNRALSGSAALERPHIINPHAADSPPTHLGAWASAPNAALSDALSTVFMLMTVKEVEEYCRQNDGVAGMLMVEEEGQRKLVSFPGTDRVE